jgi:hypothetical protein
LDTVFEDVNVDSLATDNASFDVECAIDDMVELANCKDGTALDDVPPKAHKIMKLLCMKTRKTGGNMVHTKVMSLKACYFLKEITESENNN